MNIKKILAMVFVVFTLLLGSVNLAFAMNPPTTNHNTVITQQNIPYVFSLSDFVFSDTNDNPADNFVRIRVPLVSHRGDRTAASPFQYAGTLLNGVNQVRDGDFVQVSEIQAGDFRFVPPQDETGPFTFIFQVEDDGSTASTCGSTGTQPCWRSHNYRMTIDVQTAVVTNSVPNAVDDTASVVTNQEVDIMVLSNDVDADTGDTLTITSTTQPTNGAVSILTGTGGNRVSYRSNTGFTGTDTFTYTISDGNGGSDTATVTVTVSATSTSTLTTTPNPILFDNVDRGTRTVSVTLTASGNTGGVTLTNVEFVNVDSKYQATLNGLTTPIDLSAGSSETFDVQLNIPNSEDAGNREIGMLKVSWMRGTETFQEEVPIQINPKNHLEIDRIEINGKTSGDLTVEEDNEIEVKVKNTFSEDIDDVEITVTILDVDGDDLDEDEKVDINRNDDETVTLTFDLSGDNVDEDSYVIEVKVEGEDDNGANHIVTERKTVNVDREKHRVVIRRASLDQSSLSCSLKSTNLLVSIENIGENDEEDVEIRVSNSALNIDQRKSNIDLDDYTGRNNDHRVNFPIDLQDADSGSHTFRVEVYLDGDLENSEEVTLEIQDCGEKSTQVVESGSLVDELQRGLEARRSSSNFQKSIRDGQSYLVLLGILAVLAFVAVVLALAVLFFKRR
jgi:flagellar basal body-associated protein FliL